MYADDSTIYVSAPTSTELNQVPNELLKFVEEKQLVLNPTKTSCMTIGSLPSINRN